MNRGKKIAISLGLAAGALFALSATGSIKKAKQIVSKKLMNSKEGEKSNPANFDDSDIYYV